MTIDKCVLYGSCKCQTAGCVVLPDEGCPVYRYFKDLIVKDYENRLKADMVAILEEIDLQFDKICFSKKGEWKTVPEIKAEYKAIIQQKINELKGVQDED